MFSLVIALEQENRTTPSPETADLVRRARRLQQAYWREVKALVDQRRDLDGPPAPTPTGGFTDGMEWIPADPRQRPPIPPAGYAWSVEIVGDYGVVVYTLGRAEDASPGERTEDARVIALWRNRFIAAQGLPGNPPPAE